MKSMISQTLRPELTGLFIVIALLAAACSPSAAASNSTETMPATGGEIVQVANNAEFGQILVTPDGKTLYTNTVDTPEDLRCINIACTGFWPPYTVDDKPTAGEEIPGALGTVTRPDGSQQLTYNQQPLYTFYLDRQPGDVEGNGFTDFGGTWHVVTVGGPAVDTSSDSNSVAGGYRYP